MLGDPIVPLLHRQAPEDSKQIKKYACHLTWIEISQDSHEKGDDVLIF